MPTLTDPRAEAFAQHRAPGANLEDAYDLAGFSAGQGHASRFARRPKVAARVRELIDAGRRQPITGQDIAFELQRMVQHFDDFDSPERMRETRETLMELRKVQAELERERAVERAVSRRTSPQTARTSPKPPVSAHLSQREREGPSKAGRVRGYGAARPALCLTQPSPSPSHAQENGRGPLPLPMGEVFSPPTATRRA